MTQFVCPECATGFDGELIEGSAGERDSPCGAVLSSADFREVENLIRGELAEWGFLPNND